MKTKKTGRVSRAEAFRKTRLLVFSRDRYRCAVCGSKIDIDIHPIVSNPRRIDQWITLCGSMSIENCMAKADSYWISGGRWWEPGFHPGDLIDINGT